jgi:hypothetical protein
MQLRIVMPQPQRNRIRRAARLGDQLGLEPRPRRGDARRLARDGRDFRGEYDVGFGVLGDCPRRPGKRAAEEVDAVRHCPSPACETQQMQQSYARARESPIEHEREATGMRGATA